MTTYFVSRHPGAKDWAAQQGMVIDQQLAHLDPATIQSGDLVIGTLPIHLVEAVCVRGGCYRHLTLDVPETWRGRDLSAEDMHACRARLEEYRAVRINPPSPQPPDQRQLFVAIATGQAVANLPPILEYAEPGDAVLWVESPEARERQWTAGANEVLKGFGLAIMSPNLSIHDINDPVEIQRAAKERAAEYPDWRPVIIANGGPKLSPIGLLKAWEPRQPVILYGNVPVASLRIFPVGLEELPQDRLYQRHRLDLEEILRCSGHAYFHPDRHPATRLWPGDTLPPATDEYGVDPDRTCQIHQEHHRHAVQDGEFPTFADMMKLSEQGALPPRDMKKWRGALLDFFHRVKKGSCCNLPATFLDQSPDTPSSLYNATCHLIKAANRRQISVSQPASHLGKLFEQAVADRLISWLKQWPQAPRVLQSVWSNIRICRVGAPDDQIAEWDLVLVLRNGSLCCIECKAFDANRKDLDARLLALQKASSNLADLVVCAPLYTGFTEEKWFTAMRDLKVRMETASRFKFLPFTLPDQPPYYRDPPNPEDRRECPSFEEALEKLLKRHVGSA